MSDDLLEPLPDYETSPDEWLDVAERNFDRKRDIIKLIMEGHEVSDKLSESDVIIMELRLMELIRQRHSDSGMYNVMDEFYSLSMH